MTSLFYQLPLTKYRPNNDMQASYRPKLITLFEVKKDILYLRYKLEPDLNYPY